MCWSRLTLAVLHRHPPLRVGYKRSNRNCTNLYPTRKGGNSDTSTNRALIEEHSLGVGYKMGWRGFPPAAKDLTICPSTSHHKVIPPKARIRIDLGATYPSATSGSSCSFSMPTRVMPANGLMPLRFFFGRMMLVKPSFADSATLRSM